MSLITIAQDAVDEIGFDRPSTIIGNTTPEARRLLRLCNKEGESLAQTNPPWNILHKEGSITMIAADQDYALPSDFRNMIPDTAWDRDAVRQVMTPITPSEWQYFKAWDTVNGLNYRARIRNDQLEFEQAITAGDAGSVIYFEYISKFWSMSTGDTTADQIKFVADSDIIVFDEELFTQGVVWRLLESLGLDWQYSYKMYNINKRQKLARTASARAVNLSGNGSTRYLGVNIPEDGYS